MAMSNAGSTKSNMAMNDSLDLTSKQGAINIQNSELKAYDFKTPKKFTKSDLKAISRVADTFTKLLANGISGMTRLACEVSNPQLKEISYAEILDNLPSQTLIGFLSMRSEKFDMCDHMVMFHLPQALGFFFVDILMGGSGKAIELDRHHTEIEVAILRNVIEKFCAILERSWISLAKIEFRLEKTETNPELIQLKNSSEVELVMSFDISIKQITQTIFVAISTQFLENLLTKSTTHTDDLIKKQQDIERDNQRRDKIYESLEDTEIELKAVLAEFTLDMSEIAALQVDDVIPLDKKITDNICVKVDETPWFYGKLGQVNIKKAVKLCEAIPQKNED